MEKHSQVTVILIPTLIFISFVTLNNSLDLRVSMHSLLSELGDLILRVHQTRHIGKSNAIINMAPFLNKRSSAGNEFIIVVLLPVKGTWDKLLPENSMGF